MRRRHSAEPHTDEVFLAGQRVQPGIYRDLYSRREVYIEHEDYLPASLDGRIACYVPVRHMWGNNADAQSHTGVQQSLEEPF